MAKTLKLYNPKRVGRRTCGNCVGCCLTPTLSAPPHKTLGQHCTEVCTGKKKGCGIYESRPEGCRAYQCHWLFNGFLETKHRPDKIGIIFDDGQIRKEGFWEKLGHDLKLPLPPLTAREIWPGAFNKNAALLKNIATTLVVIMVRNPQDPNSQLRIIGPNQEVINAVWDAVMALAKEEGIEGADE